MRDIKSLWKKKEQVGATELTARLSGGGALLSLIAVLLGSHLVYLMAVFKLNGFSISFTPFWLAMGGKLLFDLALFLALSGTIRALTARALPLIIFTICYCLLLYTDLMLMLFGNTHLEREHLALVTTYSIASFINPTSVLLLLLFVLTATLLFVLQRRAVHYLGRLPTVALIVITSISYFIDLPAVATRKPPSTALTFSALDYAADCRLDELRQLAQALVPKFIKNLIFAPVGPGKLTADIMSYEPAIDLYQLALGPRQYDKLDLAPINKVVLFASESISLSLISSMNPELLSITTPFFYDQSFIATRMLTNYTTSASTTLPALVATLTSHPNHRLVLGGKYQNALPRLLKEYGYHTIFLRSASKYFGGENRIFQRLGYDEIIAAEEFMALPAGQPYVKGWGVADRLVFGKLVELLETRKDEKLFITVLGADTHPPNGRADYHDLVYPPEPEGFSHYPRARNFLRAIYRHDFDMSQTLQALIEKGLLDQETLLVFTADHAAVYNYVMASLPGATRGNLAKIPLVFFSGQNLPGVPSDIQASQLDLAPTLAHLVGVRTLPGWWGESLFSSRKKDQYIGNWEGLHLYTGSKRLFIGKDDTSAKYQDLVELYNTVITE